MDTIGTNFYSLFAEGKGIVEVCVSEIHSMGLVRYLFTYHNWVGFGWGKCRQLSQPHSPEIQSPKLRMVIKQQNTKSVSEVMKDAPIIII